MVFALPFPEIGPNIVDFELFGIQVAIRWYAMAYIVGIIIGWRMAVSAVWEDRLWRRDIAPITPREVDDFITWVIVGVILGGRLGFVIFYNPGYYLQNPHEILYVWQGGMAFHGGLIGVIVAIIAFALKNKLPMLSLGDLVGLATPPGLFLGRVANFINGELWGRGTDVPWAFVFPDPRSHICPGIEGICARHPSQLYEAVLEGLILGAFILWLVWRRGALKRPGFTLGVFLTGYGVGRFIVEYFRQADLQFITAENPMGYAIYWGDFGLQMGQLLSLPMILIGLGFIAWAYRPHPRYV
ncbi:MAG: prolipoprotein diacylglyceryl transferase [Pseudomonadota bacterium]